MDSEKLMWAFIDKLNHEVMDTFDYSGYTAAIKKHDCGALATMLQQIHQVFRAVYQTQDLRNEWSKVLAPAVFFLPDRGEMLLGLAHLDLEDGGALCGYCAITPFGLYHSQDGADTPAATWMRGRDQTPPHYYCTALIHRDKHTDFIRCPIKILAMLAVCREEPIAAILKKYRNPTKAR